MIGPFLRPLPNEIILERRRPSNSGVNTSLQRHLYPHGVPALHVKGLLEGGFYIV